jgi:sirohydrochlorin ferrochelatase
VEVMTGIVLVSHGSRSGKTKEEVLSLIEQLKARVPGAVIECGFLEIESPSIPQGIDLCVHKGADDIVILLNFLNSGRHVNNDIPAIVLEAQKKYPQVQLRISKPVGQHPRIADLFLDLLK